MTLLAAALLLLQPAGPAAGNARASAWAGAWKSAIPEAHATFEITDVGAGGFALDWDENVGHQSARVRGRAAWREVDRARFETPECALTLTRRGSRLEAAFDDRSCFNWVQYKALPFVRADVPVYQRTSFDCSKASGAIEQLICADRGLATADRRLAETYRIRTSNNGPHADALRAAQRDWMARRDADCAPSAGQRACLFRAYGRRQLELRAWPGVPFEGDRVNVAVVSRTIGGKGALGESGVRELIAGLVGGTPDEMALTTTVEPGGIWLSGCDIPDRSQGYDPLGMNCGRQHYIAFREDGTIWAAWADGQGVKVVPERKPGQDLPASLERFIEDNGLPDDSLPDR